MKAELTELVFILDRSGSMSGLEDETIRGFNKMIQEQKDLSGKKKERNVNVTTILFDDQVDIIHDRFPLEIIKPLTKEEYFVRGCTALLDAIGTAVEKTAASSRGTQSRKSNLCDNDRRAGKFQ